MPDLYDDEIVDCFVRHSGDIGGIFYVPFIEEVED